LEPSKAALSIVTITKLKDPSVVHPIDLDVSPLSKELHKPLRKRLR